MFFGFPSGALVGGVAAVSIMQRFYGRKRFAAQVGGYGALFACAMIGIVRLGWLSSVATDYNVNLIVAPSLIAGLAIAGWGFLTLFRTADDDLRGG